MKKILALVVLHFSLLSLQAQWTSITHPMNYIYGAEFINDSTGFLLSGQGYVERTQDGGMTWDSIGTNYIYSWLNTAFFIDDQTGFLGGGANFPFPPSSISDLILKTTDGGLSFDSIYGSQTGSDIQSISFADENYGIFLGWYENFKTNDGGLTLDTFSFPNPNLSNFGSAVDYVDQQHIFALTHQFLSGAPLQYIRYLFLSNDQGDSWTQLYQDTITNANASMQFLSPTHGIIANDGQVLQTMDGGQSWQTIFTSSDLIVQELHFINSNTGFLTAQLTDTSYLYSTLDGGNTWQIELIDTNFQASHLSVTDHQIFVSDYQKIFKRTIDSVSVGIRQANHSIAFEVYPNPSSGIIQVLTSNTQIQKYQLINTLGQQLMSGSIQDEEVLLDLSSLNSGHYTLVLYDDYKPLAFKHILLDKY